jgi:hypothetical protein
MKMRKSLLVTVAAFVLAAGAFGVSTAAAAPSVSAPTCSKVSKKTFTCTASYSDIKATSCTINFGDGTGDQAGTLTPGSVKETGTCSATHTYAKKGTYLVSATVYEKDKGTTGPSTAVKAG